MHAENSLWLMALPLVSLVLLVVLTILRVSRRSSYAMRFKGLGVELNITVDSSNQEESNDGRDP